MLVEAAKVAVVATASFTIEPLFEQVFPYLNQVIRFFLCAAASALLLEFVLVVLFGWPRITIVWELKDETVRALVARFSPRKPSSQPFNFKVEATNCGWLGYKLLRLLLGKDSELRVAIDRAQLFPICEQSSQTLGRPAVLSQESIGGFGVRLGELPELPGPWHYAIVRWENRGTPSGEEFNVRYKFENPSNVRRWILNRIVRRPNNASSFQQSGG